MTFSPGIMRMIRYAIVGVTGAIIQMVSLWLWVGVFDLQDQYLWGIVIGFCLALAVTFPLQKYWSFQDSSRAAAPRQFVSYTLIALCSVCLNVLFQSAAKTVLEHMHADFFHVWYLTTQAVIVVVLAGLSFFTNRLLTFKDSNA